LLGYGDHNRKEWLENRLEELSETFAAAVGGLSVMNNQSHVGRHPKPVEFARRSSSAAPNYGACS
jgi:hypothetical protein